MGLPIGDDWPPLLPGLFQGLSVREFSEMTYYSALSLEKPGQKAKAEKMFRDLLT